MKGGVCEENWDTIRVARGHGLLCELEGGGSSVLTVFVRRVAGASDDYDLARKVHEAPGGGGERPVGACAEGGTFSR